MRGPRAEQNWQMPHPLPATDKVGKCHVVAPGGGGGGWRGFLAAGIDGCIITRKDLT